MAVAVLYPLMDNLYIKLYIFFSVIESVMIIGPKMLIYAVAVAVLALWVHSYKHSP